MTSALPPKTSQVLPKRGPAGFALLHVAELSVGRRRLHVLVLEDRLHSQPGHLEVLEELLLGDAAATQLHRVSDGFGHAIGRVLIAEG
jgi:hypothetical protein